MSREMYFLYLDGVQRGPYTVSQIGHMVNSRIVQEDALFWCDGLEQWQPVTQLIVPKSEIKKKWWRVISVVLCVVGVTGVALWLAWPSLCEVWMEQRQVEKTPVAAYWRARGVVRELVGKQKLSGFASFDENQVVMDGTGEVRVQIRGMLEGVERAWRVYLRYDAKERAWVVGEKGVELVGE